MRQPNRQKRRPSLGVCNEQRAARVLLNEPPEIQFTGIFILISHRLKLHAAAPAVNAAFHDPLKQIAKQPVRRDCVCVCVCVCVLVCVVKLVWQHF